MSTAFADSSALVTRYADEPGSDAVRALARLAVSQLARVEVPAALWRKHRLGELPATDTGVLVNAFEADYFGTDQDPAGFFTITVTAQILDHAARLVGVHNLRAYDAVQLASGFAVSAVLPEGAAFLAFDKTLRAAATAEGLHVLPE